MDFQESTKYMKEMEQKQKRKKMLILGIIFCIILIAFLAAVILYLKYQDSITFKMFINNKKVMTSKTFVNYDEKTKDFYVDLEELSEALGCSFQQGSIALTEGENLYSITGDYEKVDINLDSDKYNKYVFEDDASKGKRTQYEKTVYGTSLVIRTPANTKEIFKLNKPLKKINGTVYIHADDIEELLSISYNWDNQYRLYINDLRGLYAKYAKAATSAGYSSLSGDYENMRALVDGFIVVERDKKYGVIDTRGNVIIEAKYDRILYSQNSKEFFAYANDKVALIDKTGKQLIAPSLYQDISILDQNLDQENRLYQVKKDGKLGVVTREGRELVHPLFDVIGLDPTDELYSTLKDTIILYDKIIPLKQGNGWGYYNISTDELTSEFNLAAFGCNISNQKNGANQKSVVLIPKEVGIKGIVLMYQSGLYGIYDCNANKLVIPFSYNRIYSDTDNKTGITSYYLELNGEKTELKQFLEETGRITETEEEQNDENDTSEESSFTEEMNNLSTKGKLSETSNEDEQYFEENQNTNSDNQNEEQTEENTDGNEGNLEENPEQENTNEELNNEENSDADQDGAV